MQNTNLHSSSHKFLQKQVRTDSEKRIIINKEDYRETLLFSDAYDGCSWNERQN
jgi:hypothetical protein